jgi:hypothetical protein
MTMFFRFIYISAMESINNFLRVSNELKTQAKQNVTVNNPSVVEYCSKRLKTIVCAIGLQRIIENRILSLPQANQEDVKVRNYFIVVFVSISIQYDFFVTG